ncbi:MAG TPA: nucleotide sugar dehydrogenase [Rhodospirillales bacterium]
MPSPAIAVIGLGYVGLPLALALSRHFSVAGYDISPSRIAELKKGHDRTGEIPPSVLRASPLLIADDVRAIEGADFFIITVPTPVDKSNRPDLGAVTAACEVVGNALKKGSIVALESTVYPGVTEDVCGPVLEKASGMTAGKDFFLGYSPERINPGDRDHTVDKIVKVVAGQTPEAAKALAELYGTITSGGVFIAKNIKTAEAAKVIENAQRDVNIAFINEVAMIFNRLGLSTHDVLAAARTKWNFLGFEPGFVGGHCIGVDPFYLAYLAKELGHDPEVILAGRRINDGMAKFAADRIHQWLAPVVGDGKGAKVLVLGLTFKENVPDLRNTKAVDMIEALRAKGHQVDVHDAMADPEEAELYYGIRLLPRLEKTRAYDCVVGAVPHAVYIAFSGNTITSLVRPGGIVVDLKGMWRHAHLGQDIKRHEI